MWLKRPVYRGFKCEGKCFYPHTYPHTLMDKSCNSSFCEPSATERRSKNSRIAQMHTESLRRIFLTFVFDANRFQTDLEALPLAAAEIKIVMLAYCNLTYIYCPKESKCHPLAESVYNPSRPVTAQSSSKENQQINQKKNQHTNQ